MAIMVRDLPTGERPREKLLKCGAGALSNTELIAILLRTGTKECSVLKLAEVVLTRICNKGIGELRHMKPRQMTDILGLGEVKAATLLAAAELGRRLYMEKAQEITCITDAEDAAKYIMPHLQFEEKEHFAALLLDMKSHILELADISTGTLSASLVHPREVFLAAIRGRAAGIIIAHNHPSGDPSPSHEDIAITERLVKAGLLLDIPVYDHIIIGDGIYFSFKEKGFIQ